MNKTELIDAMAADAGISKAAAKKALESLMGSVSGTLKRGDAFHWLDLDHGLFLKEQQEMEEIPKLVQRLKLLLKMLLNLKQVLSCQAQLINP